MIFAAKFYTTYDFKTLEQYKYLYTGELLNTFWYIHVVGYNTLIIKN